MSEGDRSAMGPNSSDDLCPARVVYSETVEVRLREDGSRHIIPITDASKPAIPETLRASWRVSVDMLKDDLDVTAVVIVQIVREGLRILTSSTNPENPYAEGRLAPLGEGRYCETVIGADRMMSVTDALASPIWRDSPDSALGIESYHGVPLHWSDGSFFGSLCVLDRRPRTIDTVFEKRVEGIRLLIERDLEDLLQSMVDDETAAVAEAVNAMFRYAPGGIFSYSAEADERFSLISVNMLSFLGYTEDEFREKFENRFSLMVWHEDRERVLAEIDEQISHGSFDTCEYRIEKKDGKIVWVHDEGHIVTDENGKRWFYVVIVDITDTMDAQRQLARRNRELEEIVSARQSTLDDIPGGVRVFRKQGEHIICVNANRYYADMIGVEKEDLIGESFGENAERIHPDDRERHRMETVENLDRYRVSEGTYRFLNAKTDEYRWYHIEAALRTQPGGTELAYFHYTDVNDLKQAEREVQTDQRRFALAVKGAHLAVWEYDIPSRRLIIPEGGNDAFTRAHFGFEDNVVEDVPDSTLDKLLSDEDRAQMLALYAEVRSGSEYATADIWFRSSPDAEPFCDRFTYYVEKDADGIPVRGYGIAADITVQKQEQVRFHRSIESILSANPAALCTFQINLTEDVCYEGHGISPFILKALRSDTATGLFDRCLSIIPYEQDRQLFRSVFDRDALIAGFLKGADNRHIDYRRVDSEGRVRWVRSFVSLLKNPESGDIEGAIYSVDISHEKRRDDVFKILTGEEYDTIALFTPDTGQVEVFQISDSLPRAYHNVFQGIGDVCDFNQMRENSARTWVAAEEREKFLAGTDAELIKEALDRDGHYELTVRGEDADRGTIYRKLQHYYLDEEKREVLIATSDVTQSYLQQQRELEEKRRSRLERTLVDTISSLPASSGLFRIAADNTIVPDSYSDEFRRMVGFAPDDELFTADAYKGVHPDDVPLIGKTVAEHIDDDEPFSAVYRIITASGDYRWVSVNFNRFSFGDTDYLYTVYTDIDELKRQEEQLGEQYDAAQEYLDSVASTYLSTGRANLSQNIVEESSNSSLVPSEEASPMSYDSYRDVFLGHITNEADRIRCEQVFDRQGLIDAYARGERTRSVVFQTRSADGEIRWVRININLTKHPHTGDIIVFSATSDITQEELLKAIMDQVLPRQYDYISCIDFTRDKVVLFASGEKFLNAPGIGVGTDYRESERAYLERYVLPDDRERYAEFVSSVNIMSALQEGERYLDSFSIAETAGQKVVQIEFFPIDLQSGLVAKSRIDITDSQTRQLEQEEALREALAYAENANTAKSEFLSRMSHDMRTPLNGIIGITYLTDEMEMSDEVRANLSKIDTSSKFLLGLINDILDMTKAESSEIELDPEPYPLDEFYEYMDAVIRPLCEEKHQKFAVTADLPAGVLPLFDRLRINQVIFNLLSNAVKFTSENGTIAYEARFGEPDEQGRMSVHITISDSGMGMSDDFQKVLFEPFSQEGRVDVSEARGTGLGLAIVKRLVTLMGGTISVESSVESGTTFTIDMTVDSIPADEVVGREEGDGSQVDGASLEGRHILLCEDHPLNQEIAVAILSEKGMTVEVADDGQIGVNLFARSPMGFYDAVIMDIRMPVMDGYQATMAIRGLARADAQTVPIIAMTADAFSDDIDRCLEVGMDAHIAKPVDPQMLFRVLEDKMRGERSEPGQRG